MLLTFVPIVVGSIPSPNNVYIYYIIMEHTLYLYMEYSYVNLTNNILKKKLKKLVS